MSTDFESEIVQVTAGLSKVRLKPKFISDFEQAFEKITRCAERIRRGEIPHAELSVTKTLAGPFTCGGLLILLQEPRPDHPWSRGTADVIADCPTLQSLDEGIRIGSGGKLDLRQHISLLDVRPFLDKAKSTGIELEMWEELYDRVFTAIEAKQPDVLLCMGKIAGSVLDTRLDSLQAKVCERIKIVRAAHPSHSVNYHNKDVRLREGLLKSICEACHSLNGKWNEDIWQERYALNRFHVPSAIPISSFWLTDLIDVERVIKFLDIVMMLCFMPSFRLPNPSLGPEAKARFQLEEWQQKWLDYSRGFESAIVGSERHSRTILIPIFEQMNRCVQRISWFMPTYAIHRPGILDILLGITPMFENACFSLASGIEHYKETQRATESPAGEAEYSSARLMKKMDRITTQASDLWDNRPQLVRRNKKFIGPSRMSTK